MGDFGCGKGGWTPVMKIDGNKVYYKCKPRLLKLNSVSYCSRLFGEFAKVF